eukprot:1157717-Pelagomonas_calceolata.AAC.3
MRGQERPVRPCFSLPWKSPFLGQPSPLYPKQRCDVVQCLWGKILPCKASQSQKGGSAATAVIASGGGGSHYRSGRSIRVPKQPEQMSSQLKQGSSSRNKLCVPIGTIAPAWLMCSWVRDEYILYGTQIFGGIVLGGRDPQRVLPPPKHQFSPFLGHNHNSPFSSRRL